MKITMASDPQRVRRVQGNRVRISVSCGGRNPVLRIGLSQAAAAALGLSLGDYVQAGGNDARQLCLRASERYAFGARKIGGNEDMLHVNFAADVFGLVNPDPPHDYPFETIEHKGQRVLVVLGGLHVNIVEPVGEF